MSSFEVSQPILNSPFEEPTAHWYIQEGKDADQREGRRPAIVYPPRDERPDRRVPWTIGDGTLDHSTEYSPAFALTLVNLSRERIAAWRKADYAGVSRTTHELLRHWRRPERMQPLFFAQREAAETIIFLKEARSDFLQGIKVPRDDPSPEKQAEGFSGFARYACKMATGSGKTTVMGMLAAWSILNKVQNRGDGRFSDVVLAVCPNVTIRDRLQELDPERGESSLYRTRDLVPAHLMTDLRKGKVLVTNWHVFDALLIQTGGVSAKVSRAGQPRTRTEKVVIGTKTTTARGKRYWTRDVYEIRKASGDIDIVEEQKDDAGEVTQATIRYTEFVESDTALVQRILGRAIGGKQNILVMNDEAHHAYRIRKIEEDPEDEQAELFGEDDEAEEFFQEATIWVDGLDRIHKKRGINFCVDLSATPYFLGRVGRETNRPFPWVVSDFGLMDAIESGLVKIPQLAIRDTTGADIPGYFNIWQWIIPKLTPAERGGRRANPRTDAILKYADHPIRMLAGLWERELEDWRQRGEDRPPVFILVCKTTQIAKATYEWIAEDRPPIGIPSAKIAALRNKDGKANTIRVDSKVVHESDSGQAKTDETRWMRFTLDTVGRKEWPSDRQGRILYPTGFEDLAKKLDRPMHPPGRDVRCIISVGMLTEGWDCNTVTHIIGLRPFMSQLLCEQVVGRGLRRRSYALDEHGRFTEEVAKVFGVPFEVIPFKANPTGPVPPPPPKHRIQALPGKAKFEIRFPRVEGYTRAIRNRVVVDWSTAAPITLEPGRIPPEVEMKALNVNNKGRLSLAGPGRVDDISLAEFRSKRRIQELIFDLARTLTADLSRTKELRDSDARLVSATGRHRAALPGGKSPRAKASRLEGRLSGALLRMDRRALAGSDPSRHRERRIAGDPAIRSRPRTGIDRRRRLLVEQGRA